MDYAQGNREILGNESLFLMPWREGAEEHPVARRMKKIAPLRFYRTEVEREGILKEEKTDFFYCIKNGFNDGVLSRKVPTGIHAIFRESEFHGDVYAYVSPWLSEVMAYGKAPWVPHMVRLADEAGCLRTEGRERRSDDGGRGSEAGSQWADVVVPKDAIVFGRHGGDDSFDIPWVQKAVVETAKKRPDVWFLFMNTRKFLGAESLPNIRFLPATADPIAKRKFLNTCDAMLHGRMRGETFGLSCLEFAMLGKPVLTYGGSPEVAHLEILGDSAAVYHSASELRELMEDRDRWSVVGNRAAGDGGRQAEVIGRKSVVGSQGSEVGCGKPQAETHRQPTTDHRQHSGSGRTGDSKFNDYQPEAVMKKFQEVFLN